MIFSALRIRSPYTLLFLMLLVAVACTTKSPPPAASTIAPSEHVAPPTVDTPQTVLQKTFALKTSATFPFQIPAHEFRPHLHGIFQSFVRDVRGASDDSANVDFLIVNEEEYSDLVGNHPSETLFAVEASHNQAINFDFPASQNQPVKYYLIFRSTDGGKSAKVVEADFRLDF